VSKGHPDLVILSKETARNVIKNPISIWRDKDKNSKVWYYFKEIENDKIKLLKVNKIYIVVVVKEKYGEFFVATWYNIKEIERKGAIEIWKRK